MELEVVVHCDHNLFYNLTPSLLLIRVIEVNTAGFPGSRLPRVTARVPEFDADLRFLKPAS